MYNLGLEAIGSKSEYAIPSGWAFEQVYEISNDLNKHLDALTNLVEIRKSLIKYGRTQQLNELVGASLEAAGITFSTEGIWKGIKDFFKWIKDKIVAMWKWFWGLFGFYKDAAKEASELDKAIAELAAAKQAKEPGRIKKAAQAIGRFFHIHKKEPATQGYSTNLGGFNLGISLEESQENSDSGELKLLDLKKLIEYLDINMMPIVNALEKISHINEITSEAIATMNKLYDNTTEMTSKAKEIIENEITVPLDIKNLVEYSHQCKMIIHSVYAKGNPIQNAMTKIKSITNTAEQAALKNPENTRIQELSIFFKKYFKLQTSIITIMDLTIKHAKSSHIKIARALGKI